MLRNILSIIVGWFTMAVLVFILLSITYLVLGTKGTFQPGTYDASMTWLITGLIVGIVAAAGGGIVCALIARNQTSPRVLAVVVLVVSLLVSGPRLVAETPESEERPEGEVAMFDAMDRCEQPKWFLVTTAVTGAIGVLIGAALVPGKRPPT